jgi:CRISPR-associated protein Cas1
VYDLQEPFRWIADVAVMEAFESGVLDLPDFYFTGNDYRYRFQPEAKQRLLDLLREQFNSGTVYGKRVLKWDTLIEQKSNELGKFLTGRLQSIEFVEPALELETHDSRELRAKILALTASQAKQVDIRRSTLHYLRKRAQCRESFRVYWKTRERMANSLVGDNY